MSLPPLDIYILILLLPNNRLSPVKESQEECRRGLQIMSSKEISR